MAFTIRDIHCALDDLQLLQDRYPGLEVKRIKILMHKLRSLRTFLLCAGKLGNYVHLRTEDNNDNRDGSLGSLLLRIEDAVCRNEYAIHSCWSDVEDEIDCENKIIHFLLEVESFEKDIEKWYMTLSGYSRQLSSLTTKQVLAIADSVLENLKDFLSFHRAYIGFLVEPIEALEENITFFRNFIRFATLRSAENREFQDLLTHIEALAINAAHLTVHLFSASHYNIELFSVNVARARTDLSYDGVKFMISTLLEKIKPVYPYVYETYTQALAGLKYSRYLHAPSLDMNDDPIIIMEDFIVFLLSNIWDMLLLDTCLEVSVKEQLQALYEGLRFLRTTLKKQPNKFDDNIKDLTGVVLNDAGIIIFSLYRKEVKTDLVLSELLDKLKVIREEVEEQVPETSVFSFPKINVLGFIDNLLDNLLEIKSCKVDSDTQSCVQTIGEDLVFLRSFTEEMLGLRNQHKDLQAPWNRAIEVAYRIEFLIDQLVLGDIQDSFSTTSNSITENIRSIKTDALKILHERRQEIKVQKITWTSTQVPSQSRASATDEVVGFKSETTSIINRLIRGSKKLQVIAIVGMPGSGKTTLATKVYNDPSSVFHFVVLARCSFSQAFNQKKILLELLLQILKKLPDEYFKMTEDDLKEKLRRSLKGRKYLIFLDDVWDIKDWNSMNGSLPDDCNGSRILLTGRHFEAVPEAMVDDKPLLLRQLTDDECWKLLQKKLFPGNDCPLELNELGMKIAKNCKGLPLTVVLASGLLSTTEKEVWKGVLEKLSSGIISGEEQCKNTIELSYKHLPDYLKSCFLYFGAFPEDQEVSAKRLIWLWIAEGFVRRTKEKSLAEVATDYMEDLIRRSLVMVAKQRSIGGVKACRIHDLLHDFCFLKAKEENFLQVLKGFQELSSFNEAGNLRRLCIYSKPKHFKEAKLFCPRLRSLLFFDPKPWYEEMYDISFIVRVFKLLNVLDIEQIHPGFNFPSEIGLLVRLKYLAVQGTWNVSPSIGCLANLETFILRSAGTSVTLPDTFWNLEKLRHLYLSDVKQGHCGIKLPVDNLDNSPNLYELDSLSTVFSYYWGIMEKQLRKFPNIRQLKCRHVAYGDDPENGDKFMAFSFLSQLESLDVSFLGKSTQFEFVFPENLKKLTLYGCGLPWRKVSTIGNLPNLEVLKIHRGSFSGNTWNVEEGEFSKLEFLKLKSLNIVTWTASDDQFPSLKKLVLESCDSLEKIPDCLEYVTTLEMIEVSNCSDSISSSVEQIKDTQMEMGNSDLKILVRFTEKDTW